MWDKSNIVCDNTKTMAKCYILVKYQLQLVCLKMTTNNAAHSSDVFHFYARAMLTRMLSTI